MTTTLQDIINALPEETKTIFREEVKKFQKFFQTDIKTMSGEQLASLLSALSSEKSALSVKIIQLETQLAEKQKELDSKIKEILDKYQISDLSLLEKKKEEIEAELEKQLSVLKEVVSGVQ